MMPQVIRRIYAPEFMVKKSLLRGELPDTKTVYKTAYAIAWASIVETFLLSLVSIADTMMVSTVGEHAIAAVGLVTQPRFILQTAIICLNVAIVSITARRRGENNQEGAEACLKQGLLISLTLSIFSTVAAAPFTGNLIQLAGAQPDTADLAKGYLDILLLGMPLNNISLTISAAQRGIGQTRVSMQINLTSNLVNLILNYLLIGGRMGFPKLGVHGAAIATVIGWSCGFVMAILSVANKNRLLYIFTKEGWRFEKKTLSSILRVASGSFLEQICMRTGFLLFSRIAAGLGTLMFAAHHIFLNILSLSFSFGEGFGIAASTLVGQNMGAKRPDLSIVYGKACERLSYIITAVIFLLYLFRGKQLIMLFSQDPQILKVGSSILVIMGLIIAAQCSQIIFMGALRGAGDTRYTAVVSLISIVLLRPAVAWVMAYPLGWGLIGAWMALFLDQYMRMFLTTRRFSSGQWMHISL